MTLPGLGSISDAAGAALARACRVTFSATGRPVRDRAQCLKYDAGKHQFVYNWKLGKSGVGPATITLAINYPGTSATTQQTRVRSSIDRPLGHGRPAVERASGSGASTSADPIEE